MKNFTHITTEQIVKHILTVKRLTIHEIDCLFDLHFTVEKAEVTDHNTYIVITDINRGWFTFAIDCIVEVTISDGLTVIVIDQNLLRKDE